MKRFLSLIGILKNISFDWNDIIFDIEVYYQLSSLLVVNGSDLNFSRVPSFPNCKTIDILELIPKCDAPTQIFVQLKGIKNLGVDLYMLDRHVASKRSLKSELLAYDGPTLTNPKLISVAKLEKHILKITQTKDLAEDESNGCQDYPNEKYQTFSDCDMQFVHEQMLDEGVMPFWATDNLDEVTGKR